MKIAFVGQKGIPVTIGGVERYVENVAVRLAERGQDITVYTRPYYTDRNTKEYQGVTLVSLPTLRSKHLDAIVHSFISTLHALYVARVDTIHFVNIGPALLSWIPRILRPSVTVVGKFECMDWTHKKWGPFARFALKMGAWAVCTFPHKTFATSQEIANFVKEHFNKEIPVVNNGYTIKKPLTSKELTKTLEELSLEPGQFMVSASRLIPHKGVHYLIDAFIQLKQNGIPKEHKNIKLAIAGEGFHTDEYVAKLKKMAEGRDDILFLGNLPGNGPQLQALYEGATACVLPTESEGFSLLLVEWLGYARSVVTSDIEPNLEAVTDSDGEPTAVLFKKGSTEDLYQKLDFVLKNDMKPLSMKAKKMAKNRYGWESITEKVEQVFLS